MLGTGVYQGPADSLLHNMSHCLTVTTAYHGAARSVTIDKLAVEAEGTLNLHGFLGLDEKTRIGFKHIHLQASIGSPAPTSDVLELFYYAQGRSPICQTIRNAAYKDGDSDRHGVSHKGLTDTIQAVLSDPKTAQAKFYTSSRAVLGIC